MSDITLWGFNGSTYVRTIRMLLLEKGVANYEQVSVNVLTGETKTPEHLQRHPFGKVPVLDHDGIRILETSATARYLNEVLPGSSLIPASPKDRARMDMAIGLIDSCRAKGNPRSLPAISPWRICTSRRSCSTCR